MAWNKKTNTSASSKRVFACLLKAGVAIISCEILFACSDDAANETITQIVQENVIVVSEVSELPNCTPENEGKQAFVRGENASRICVDGNWFASFVDNSDKHSDFKCDAEQLIDGSGLKILCNGDSIGVLLNGSNGIQGIQGEQGIRGSDGANGKSAYEIAKAGGYMGTESEWLESLKGADGINGSNGVDGKSAYEIAKDGGYTGTEDEWLESLKGVDGINGSNGVDGKSAYEIAKEGGFTGTKEEWQESLKGESCSVKRVGDFITIECGKTKVSFTGGVYGTLTDERDQKTYKTVVIGEQTWMAENLNYYDTIAMPLLKGRSSCPTEEPINCSVYGRYYLWSVAMDSAGILSTNSKGCGYDIMCSPSYPVRGICPEGWHLPTREDFLALFTTVGGMDLAGKNLKAVNHWYDESRYYIDSSNTDAYGFSALPSGYCNFLELPCYEYAGGGGVGISTYFHTATQTDKSSSVHAELIYGHDDARLMTSKKNRLMQSIRCLKDSE